MFYSFSNRPPRVLTPSGGVSMTLQDAKDECDINMIIARHDRTGSWSGSMKEPTAIPQFGEFDSVSDFQSAQDTIIRAREHFASLPSHVRSRFDNDPVRLLEFVSTNPIFLRLFLLASLSLLLSRSTLQHNYLLDVIVLTDTKILFSCLYII